MTDAGTRFEVPQERQEVILSRSFHASPERLFRAYTEPAEVARWWGPGELINTVEEMEIRRGGRWRIVQRDPLNRVHAFHGVHHEVRPNQRIVRTFEYEGAPGHVLLETVTFAAVDGGTLLTTTSVYQSLADRDQMVAAGMEGGAVESMERLAAVVGGG